MPLFNAAKHWIAVRLASFEHFKQCSPNRPTHWNFSNMSQREPGKVRAKQSRVDWYTFVSSLPEPSIFIVSLALSLFFIFQNPESTWLGLGRLVDGLNGSPSLSDAVAIFIPACITAFGSLFFISISASGNIRNQRLRDMIITISFIISLLIVGTLVLLVNEFRDALATCSNLTNVTADNTFQCSNISAAKAEYLNLVFLSITGLTIISMILSKFVIVVFRDR